MIDALARLTQNIRDKLQKASQPDWVEPMLATLTDQRFSDQDWIFERKLDGERCLAFRDADGVRLMSRNQKILNTQYPEVTAALEQEGAERFIVDGEIVAFEGNVSSFAKLQGRMHVSSEEEARHSDVAVFMYLFDILHLEGYDTTQVDQRHRKAILKAALSFEDPLRFTNHRNEEGEAFLEEACRRGWEGIIAKDAHGTYVHGRSRKWLKFKCVNQQEFVIGGYTEPHGERIGLGALLLGYYDEGALRYAGKVGTGFTDEMLESLCDRLHPLEVDEPPFKARDLPTGKVRWVEPKLVAEIGFEEWTEAGKLRQPRFKGLREDKPPEDVVREEAQT
jgi:bifunctional non-homologous end joining protein LigD